MLIKRKKMNFKIYICLFVCLFFATNLYSQEAKWIQIGALHGWFAANGSEVEVGLLSSQQQNGLRWPAFFTDQDCQVAKGLWIGAKNFTDERGNTYANKVICVGTRLWGQQFLPVTLSMGTRFPVTQIYVDGMNSTYIQNYVNEDPNPDLSADRVITNVVNTVIGIQMTRTIYGFSHQDHDNYFIYEYEFKNTGVIDRSNVPTLNSTLEGVYFYFCHRYSPGREGCISARRISSTAWGISTLFESIGDDDNSTSPFRAIWASQGRYSSSSYPNIGMPDMENGTHGYARANGHLGSPQYVGWLTIHADRSATDNSDDRSQPKTVSYEQSDHSIHQYSEADQFNPTKMGTRYAWMTKGYVKPRHNELVGSGYVDRTGGGSTGGTTMGLGYGPYTLEIGQSVKIVVAEAVAGLNRDECYRIGAEWLAGTCTFPGSSGTTIPGSVAIPATTNSNDAKDSWVATGRDSVLQTFQRATDNWNSGLKLPKPPNPPTVFDINSGGDRISLSWSNSSESDPTLKSYRLYRADSSWDSRNYQLIAELPKGTLSYNDLTPTRGFSYYYYLQCVGDGSNNGGVELVSNRQLTQTYEPATLMREAVDDMAQIRVVPNPFNVRARDLQYKGERDKIMFLDIPGQCTIRIYTERGDLIKTINHTNGSGDDRWDCVTEYRQVVVSGLYIAHFETPDGRSTYRKFVVIR